MKKAKVKIYEVDLYDPIRNFLTQKGYQVNGEVNHCDLTALKDDELLIVELKRHLTVDLLIQATKRQRLTDLVYIAIPKPAYSLYSKKWHDICYLVKRLELGLLLVSFQGDGAVIEAISPKPFDRLKSMQQNKKKRNKLVAEINGRHGDYNVGGSNKTKLMTAYKENCVQIAYFLDQFGPTSPKSLRRKGTGDKTLSILSKNYYGWFEKVGRGTYAISEKGKNEIYDFPHLIKHFTALTLVREGDEATEAIQL
ncbi:DUF2161 domain-containing phosphodiesterase [Brevibacillus sp. SYSU BS000544]|uniref:DUF2161 domain-containing phosphodiesterase n=1 Tax=Brevibacillus sp. SYSU BS000544 TaxID=3416443 RepID=UPI003CE57DDF